MISIIVPVYNKGNRIEKALKSVLSQTIQEIEVIVVDDGSTDNSVKIVEDIQDDRIFLIKNEKNSGANYARNLGISKAHGEYIAFQDGDDIWHREKLERSLKVLQSEGVDIVFTAFVRKFSNGYEEKLPNYNLNEAEDKMKSLLFDNCVATPTILAKRNVFDNILFDESMPKFQDWEFALRAIKKYMFFYLDEVLVTAYVENNGLTMNMHNSVIALQRIMEKNSDIISIDRKLRAKFYMLLGDFNERDDTSQVNSSDYYKASFDSSFSIKVLVKFLLAKTGVLKKILHFRSKKKLSY